MNRYRDTGHLRPLIERLYRRHEIPRAVGYTVQVAGKAFPLAQLSYGGFGIEEVSEWTELPSLVRERNPQTVSFQLLGIEFQDRAIPTYANARSAGFELMHDHAGVMSSLRQLIPFLECGRSMAGAEEEGGVSSESDLAEPVAELVSFGKSLGLGEVCYRVGRIHYRVLVDAQGVTTWHDVHRGAVLEGLRQTYALDQEILRNAQLLLLGLMQVFPEDERVAALAEALTDDGESRIDLLRGA